MTTPGPEQSPGAADYYRHVNYSIADPAKVLAQQAAAATVVNLPEGITEVPGIRGESAHVIELGNGIHIATVPEGLGTKSIVARAMYTQTGKPYFREVAKDSVFSITNDLISCGAIPAVVNAYWASSSYDWLADPTIRTEFITGWREACDEVPIAWGAGETQSLPGIIIDDELEFAGSAIGIMWDRQRLIQGQNIQAGDAVVLLEANGVHANGLSLIREVAANLPAGYLAPLADGTTFGETIMKPTISYARVVDALLKADIDVHYLSNITGHGWRKIMRGSPEFTYRMHFTPTTEPIYDFIADKANNDPRAMYSNFNMGAGYAIYVPQQDANTVCRIAVEHNIQAWHAGTVEAGPKQVIIEPLQLTYDAASLAVRS